MALLTTTEIAAVVVLPAASRAVAVRVWEPFATVVVVQLTAKGATVSSAPRSVPSTLKRTPATPTLSAAVAETVRTSDTVEPAGGLVRVTVGATVSGTGFATVTVRAVDDRWLPAASRARATSVQVPFWV